MPGYWVFSRLVQALADVGYDSNSVVALAVRVAMSDPPLLYRGERRLSVCACVRAWVHRRGGGGRKGTREAHKQHHNQP